MRTLLENIVYTKEVWAAALTGSTQEADVKPTTKSQRTPETMLARMEKADEDLQRLFGEVGAQGNWDDTFVDALCERAETFTFGGVFAHIMTFDGHRRLLALDALRRLGVDIHRAAATRWSTNRASHLGKLLMRRRPRRSKQERGPVFRNRTPSLC